MKAPFEERVFTLTKYLVQGGHPLFGEVEISGAKNAAVAIIPAALLVDGVCRIENIPQISDVTLSLKILEHLGAGIRVLNRHTVEIDASRIRSTRTSYELARKMRASYYLIGSLLGRFGQAEVAMPGGCNFGVPPHRPARQGLHRPGRQGGGGGRLHPRRPRRTAA